MPKNYFLLHVGAYLVPAEQGSSVFVQSCYTTDLGYVVMTLYCSSHFLKFLDSWLFSCQGPAQKVELKVANVCLRQVYYWAIGSNLVMRGAWTYKLSAHLRHNFRTVFFFSFLEMCRRFQWIFFRVEIAAIKLSNSGGALPRVTSQIPLKDLSGDTEHLITASE